MVTLSLDINKLIKAVKRAAIDAVAAQKPMAYYLGEVESVAPLRIRIDQKLILTEAQLVLTSAVRDFDVEMTVDHTTETESGGSGEGAYDSHLHKYVGLKKFTVHLGLQVNERVVLIRCDGGQKFIVLDRVR